ncbi:hypothetical protein ACKAV7_015235 [Fusarium commune]
MASTQQLQTPDRSREGTPEPESKQAQNKPLSNNILDSLGSLTPQQQQAIRNALIAGGGGAPGAPGGAGGGAGGATDAPGGVGGGAGGATDAPGAGGAGAGAGATGAGAGATGATGAEFTPVLPNQFESAFLDTMSETLPELGGMCQASDVLSTDIWNSCSQFKRQYPDRNLIDFLVYMEHQALTNETDEDMKDEMIKYIQDPTIQLPVNMKTKHDASMQKIRDLRVDAARQFYTPPELKFLTEHAPQHLPIIGALNKDHLADFTIKFCFEYREQHPKDDIFELLFYAERMMTVSEKDAGTKIQEFIQQEKLPRIEDMDFGTDTHLIKLRRQEALSILEGLRKPQPDPREDQQSDTMDRAVFYDAAKRRGLRDQFVGKAEDPSADRCMITDPETKQPVQAEIIGRHPHRRKHLVCAIPSHNPLYPGMERFPTIDGTKARTLLALLALQNDPKLSIRRAATIYEIKEQRLRRRRNGIQSRVNWIPKSRKISDLEEEVIVQFILDLDSRGFPPRLRGVEEMANRLLADRNASPVGKRWASNFIKRHPDLKMRFFRNKYNREIW